MKKNFMPGLSLVLCLIVLAGFSACNPTVSVAPSPSPPVTIAAEPASIPPETIENRTITVTPDMTALPVPLSTAIAPALTLEPAPSSPVPTTTAPPVTRAALPPAEVNLVTNKATNNFPDSITFMVEGSSSLPLNSLTLEYGTNKRSVVDTVSRVQITTSHTTNIRASYTWEMKKTGSLPPRAEVWYQWKVNDDASRTYTSTRQTLVFDDTRFVWKQRKEPNFDEYFLNQPADLLDELAKGVQSNLSRIELNVSIPEERRIKVLLYDSYDQVRSSGLFNQQWMGGGAYPNYNIIVMVLTPETLDWARGALPHEITHLLVGEAVFGPFGDIPHWLSEGLAGYAEGDIEPDEQGSLLKASHDGKLLSIRTLSSSFPADSAQANLAYIESHSIVTYLIDTCGWAKMRELLSVYKDGSTNDNALRIAYSMNTTGLEVAWEAYLEKK
jgi:hypothetical protein